MTVPTRGAIELLNFMHFVTQPEAGKEIKKSIEELTKAQKALEDTRVDIEHERGRLRADQRSLHDREAASGHIHEQLTADKNALTSKQIEFEQGIDRRNAEADKITENAQTEAKAIIDKAMKEQNDALEATIKLREQELSLTKQIKIAENRLAEFNAALATARKQVA